ncbi:hypothetical protein D3C71_1542470 [compost metagenome]
MSPHRVAVCGVAKSHMVHPPSHCPRARLPAMYLAPDGPSRTWRQYPSSRGVGMGSGSPLWFSMRMSPNAELSDRSGLPHEAPSVDIAVIFGSGVRE